jgi:hypothetical protein
MGVAVQILSPFSLLSTEYSILVFIQKVQVFFALVCPCSRVPVLWVMGVASFADFAVQILISLSASNPRSIRSSQN